MGTETQLVKVEHLYKEFDEKIVGYTMHINYEFLKKMIPDIKNIYFNIDEPFLNKKITKYMMGTQVT